MADLATVSAAITGVKNAFDIAKYLRDSTTTLQQAEVKLKLADLISALVDSKIELAAVQETLLAQEREIRELTDRLNFVGNMKYEPPYYWNVSNEKRDGPFCQRCWDGDAKSVRLQSYGDGSWHCKVCDKHYTDSSYREPDPNRGFRRG